MLFEKINNSKMTSGMKVTKKTLNTKLKHKKREETGA